MMRSKEFYEESISRLQKMIKYGVCVLLFDVFAVAVQIPFIFAGKLVAAHLILSIAVSFMQAAWQVRSAQPAWRCLPA